MKRQGGTPVNDIRIEPWDHLLQPDTPDVLRDQFVPAEVENVALHVVKSYDMQVGEMKLISSKPVKGGAVWKLVTDHGLRSMKLLCRTPDRSLFSIYAQDYLVKQGAKVPSLIPTRDGGNYVSAGGRLWIVTEWIESLQPACNDTLGEARALSAGLGEFHRLSNGFNPPSECMSYSHLGSWLKSYEKSIEDFGNCRQLAELHPEFESGKRLLSQMDRFEEQARNTIQLMAESPYEKMVAMGELFWGLAQHNDDRARPIAQTGPGGVWVIDLSGVCYDLPIRDLRKLISNTMVERGGWDVTWIRGMIEAYHQSNPIDRETFQMLWLDLSFPNELHRGVKEILSGPIPFIKQELEDILDSMQTMEASKQEALSELRLDLELYPSNTHVYLSAAEPTNTSMDQEEQVWGQFIQHELNKVQPEDAGKSWNPAVVPETLETALRHAASYLIARLKKAQEQEGPEGNPVTEGVADRPSFDAIADPADFISEETAGMPETEPATDEEEMKWRQFIQHELNKAQHGEGDESPERAIAPELIHSVMRHLSSYLLARLKKAREDQDITDEGWDEPVYKKTPKRKTSHRTKKSSSHKKDERRRDRSKTESRKTVKRTVSESHTRKKRTEAEKDKRKPRSKVRSKKVDDRKSKDAVKRSDYDRSVKKSNMKTSKKRDVKHSEDKLKRQKSHAMNVLIMKPAKRIAR
jgi:CotS family spore coat protein